MTYRPIEHLRRKAQHRFAANQTGSVMVIAALTLPLIVGVAALAAEYGSGLMRQVENQRVADAAAFAAATAYARNGSNAEMLGVARQLAALHGIAPEEMVIELATAPGSSAQAVRVQITTRNTLFLAPLFGIDTALNVGAEAFAGFGEGAGGCIIALNPAGPGVVMSGTASVTANHCAVASNHTVTVPCGTEITAEAITYNGSAPTPCAAPVNMRGPDGGQAPIAQTPVTDPLMADSGVAALRSRFDYVEGLPWKSLPSGYGGVDMMLYPGGEDLFSEHLYNIGCYVFTDWVTSYWDFDCPDEGVYDFGALEMWEETYKTIDFNPWGHPNSIYYFNGPVVIDHANVRFGPGIYYLFGGLKIMNESTVEFGSGTFHILDGSAWSANCTPDMQAGICVLDRSELVFSGDTSDFSIYGGIYAAEDSSVRLGEASLDSVYVGVLKDDRGRETSRSIYLDSGAELFLADAVTGDDTYTVMGNVETRDQTCLTFGAAANHDIRGNMELNGSTRLGEGIYTLTGYFAVGTHASAPTRCWSSNVGLRAENVSIAVSGRHQLTSGPCADASFCIGSGFSNFVLTAPVSGPYKSLAIVGPSNNSTAAVINGSSAMSNLVGIVYYPNGPVRFASASSGGGTPENCLQIIGLNVAMTAAGSIVSECISTGGGSGRVALVQ